MFACQRHIPINTQKDLTIHCKVETEVLFFENIRFYGGLGHPMLLRKSWGWQ